MKIESMEDLERLMRLLNEHKVEEVIVGDVTLRKSAYLHEQAIVHEAAPGTPRPLNADDEGDDDDELLFWSADS